MSPDPICGSGYETKIYSCIVRANSAKCTYLVTIAVLKQYRIVKGKVDPPECLFLPVTQIEKITLIEQSVH